MHSPRKLLRRLSAADEVDKELVVSSGDVSLVKEEEEGDLTATKVSSVLVSRRSGCETRS